MRGRRKEGVECARGRGKEGAGVEGVRGGGDRRERGWRVWRAWEGEGKGGREIGMDKEEKSPCRMGMHQRKGTYESMQISAS